jgi:hypothetical protein
MFTKGTEAHHQGRECVIVETNYLGIRIQYLDDETFLFIKASHFDELMMIEKTPEIKPVDDKRLPSQPFKPKFWNMGAEGFSQASFEMHARRRNSMR